MAIRGRAYLHAAVTYEVNVINYNLKYPLNVSALVTGACRTPTDDRPRPCALATPPCAAARQHLPRGRHVLDDESAVHAVSRSTCAACSAAARGPQRGHSLLSASCSDLANWTSPLDLEVARSFSTFVQGSAQVCAKGHVAPVAVP